MAWQAKVVSHAEDVEGMSNAERPWIIGAAACVVALVVVIGFAVSYSPAEPTEEKSPLPVFGGTTEIPGATTLEGPVAGATEAAATTAAATTAAAQAASTEAQAAATVAQAATTEDSGGGGSGSGDDSAGKPIFAANCAGCHGADGTGGVGPNLTTLPAAADPARVVRQVTNGGAVMPSFSGTLSDQQIQERRRLRLEGARRPLSSASASGHGGHGDVGRAGSAGWRRLSRECRSTSARQPSPSRRPRAPAAQR